jgi:hypothetical protein
MVQRTYNCTQQELYTVCRLGWQSFEQHLVTFTDFKKKYEPPFAADRIAEVEAAATLPDDQARGAVSETFRIQLEQLSKICLANWQKLKRYIADAWPPELQKPNIEAAGQNHYNKAGNNDWEAVRALLTSGSNFLTANQITLEAGNNMPAAFIATFNNTKTDFETKHQEFLDSEETAVIQSDIKVKTNNDIHTKLMAMFLDGQELFKTDTATVKQFIFEQVLNLASGTGTAGFRGIVTDKETSFPIEGVSISIKGTEKATLSDADGKFIITQVAAGSYIIDASKEAYEVTQINQVVKTGTISTLNFTMVKL